MQYNKYSGAGNSFLILDNTKSTINSHKDLVLNLISQKGNENFDGVIFVENSDIADFRMNYFNKDGTGDTLCGNGLRCTVKFIENNNLSDKKILTLEAVSKIYECHNVGNGLISVGFPPPNKVRLKLNLKVQFREWWQMLKVHYADVGSPHIVVFIKDIMNPIVQHLYEIDIDNWGKNIRMHKDLMPEGANVNFVKLLSYERSELEIRSYERGVEGETLSCGTGAISTAIIAYLLYDIIPPIKILTKSGEFLTVDFRGDDGTIRNLTLTGKAVEIND
jgi:diaminopimelate epimerase